MTPLHQLIEQINTISRKIMAELEKQDPSVELINYEMNRRAEFVKELDVQTKVHPPQSLNDEERSGIKSLMDIFTELNRIIQRDLKKLMAKQKDHLEKTMSHRKAIKGYKISKTPDISYF